MSYAARYIETAGKIIAAYDGSIPLHHFLKQFFAADKKYGSKDRKAITHACYCFYRLGKAMGDLPVPGKIKAGIFLCSGEPGLWASAFDDAWIDHWNADLRRRISFLQPQLDTGDIFSLHDEISNTLDKDAFILSHLVQPDLHIRIRPGKEDKITKQLSAAAVPFEHCGGHCLALPNSSKIDKVISVNEDVVVQDLSSQRIAELLSSVNDQLSTIKTWDCCAASGGKSMLAYDMFRNIDLTVSDVRASIIQNLKKRFAEAGIKHYRSFIADLSANHRPPTANPFDLIICDAPCSGSGTWGRTPEQLSFFQEDKINYYADLQKKITTNIIPSLAANGYLLYITCSVFKKENEEVVEYIKANTSVQLLRMEYLKGYDTKADTMFAALFIASAP
jgi:16S rRNA (cytosine967-C5)-methyltransferase